MTEVDELDLINCSNDTADISYDDETIIWEGKPSQWLNIGEYMFWSIVWLSAIYIYFAWNIEGLSAQYSEFESLYTILLYVLAIIPPIMMIWAWLVIHYEKTEITRNKITEYKGVTRFFSDGKDCEIAKIDDIKMPPAGILSLVGCATLILMTSDDDQPIIKIRAIKDRDKLKTIIYPIWRKLYNDRKGYFNN